jgi:hypothetical protein
MKRPDINFEAMQAVILAELARQGIEFGQVSVHKDYGGGGEHHVVIEAFNIEQLNPKYIENTRISNQITTGATNHAS